MLYFGSLFDAPNLRQKPPKDKGRKWPNNGFSNRSTVEPRLVGGLHVKQIAE